HLEFAEYLRDPAVYPWIAVPVGLVLCAVIALFYCLEGRSVRSILVIIPAALLVAFVFLTQALLLPEVDLQFKRQSWPDVVIIVDDSYSMSTVDAYQDARVQEVANRLADRLPPDGDLSRADRLGLARALVARGDSDWLTTLLTKRQFKLHIYH